MKIAVVTGASSGMGREFVYALDKDEPFDEIWVIARRTERLQALSDKVRAKIRPIALDLLDTASFTAYRPLLAPEQPEVAALVTAAGFGAFQFRAKAAFFGCEFCKLGGGQGVAVFAYVVA